MDRILIIDDDQSVCASLKLLLKRSSFEVMSVHQPALALDTIATFRPDIVLLDMNFSIDTSGRQGMKMLARIQELDSSIIVILITGWATLQLAVEGMKNGAKDFLAKPWDNKHLLNSIKTAIALYGRADQDKIDSRPSTSHIIGQSSALKDVLKVINKVAPTEASILITGDSGTGKELIAEAIHSQSQRKDQSFVKVNLGGISTSLFESEMFGHVKGAFTDASTDRIGRFAKAEGGTIFLDEIGDLALSSQVKLLRVLQEKSYEVLGSSRTIKSNVRVVSATHKSLTELVAAGTFREDLFYRINLIQIHVPSLHERREDIPVLVRHFTKNVSRSYDLEEPAIANEAMDWLSNQTYPGNIRQLRNIIQRTVLLSIDEKILSIRDFQSNMMLAAKKTGTLTLPNIGEVTLDELEKRMIQKALAYHNHSISKTARSLGLTRSSLYRRMEKYNVK